MSIDADNPEYHKSWLAQFFHSFPHVDLSFERTSANFTPESGKYREALAFWAGIPLIWCGILWLVFLVYSCARFCNKRPRKHSTAACSRVCAGLFLLLGCGALVVSFFGNAEVHNGIDDFVYSVNSANKTIESSLRVISVLDKTANETETKQLPALTQAFSGISNVTIRTKINDLVKQIVTNVDSAKTVALSFRGSIQSVDTEQIVSTTEHVEHYRWTATILVNCVYIGIFLLTFTALIKKSRWMLILSAVLSIIFMLAVWTSTSFYLFVGIGTGDLCVDPNTFVLSQLNGTVKQDVLLAFIKCDDVSKPYREDILNAQTAVTQAITALNITVNISLPFNISDKIAGPVTALRNDLKFMFGNLSSLTTEIGSCSTVHDEYNGALQSVCYEALEGVGYLALFLALMGLSSALLIYCSARTWPHLGRRRRRGQGQDYMRIDDTDPFLPDPPPYERNYGTMRQASTAGDNRLSAGGITINDEARHVMTLPGEGESPPPAYQAGHYMQQYNSLAPTPSSVAQSTHMYTAA